MKELARDVDVLERLRLWLELRPGTQLALQSSTVNGRLTTAAAVSRSYELPEPHGTWASVVDVTRAERPLALAIEQATELLERAEVQTRGRP